MRSSEPSSTSLQIDLYAIGAIALVYGVVRVWRLVNPSKLPPAKDRLSEIKGPMSFTEAEGDLLATNSLAA